MSPPTIPQIKFDELSRSNDHATTHRGWRRRRGPRTVRCSYSAVWCPSACRAACWRMTCCSNHAHSGRREQGNSCRVQCARTYLTSRSPTRVATLWGGRGLHMRVATGAVTRLLLSCYCVSMHNTPGPTTRYSSPEELGASLLAPASERASSKLSLRSLTCTFTARATACCTLGGSPAMNFVSAVCRLCRRTIQRPTKSITSHAPSPIRHVDAPADSKTWRSNVTGRTRTPTPALPQCSPVAAPPEAQPRWESTRLSGRACAHRRPRACARRARSPAQGTGQGTGLSKGARLPGFSAPLLRTDLVRARCDERIITCKSCGVQRTQPTCPALDSCEGQTVRADCVATHCLVRCLVRSSCVLTSLLRV